jgi:hypothetical protein
MKETSNHNLHASLPALGSGSLAGAFENATGNVYGGGANANTRLKMFEDIDVSSIQGLEASNYTDALNY